VVGATGGPYQNIAADVIQPITSSAINAHPLASITNLIELYEAWGKPEEAEEWRTKLPRTEAVKE
jgi:hypothetical protein